MSGEALFFESPGRPPAQMNALALAYMGDAVYEMYVRQHLLTATDHKPYQLHRRSIQYVSANAQSVLLERVLPLLSSEELAVLKRGRNANSGTIPKNVDPVVYRRATGLESLIGYLYLTERFARLNELLAVILAVAEGGARGGK